MFKSNEEIIHERDQKLNIILRNNNITSVILYFLVFCIFMTISYVL